jgi:hypothetical protein
MLRRQHAWPAPAVYISVAAEHLVQAARCVLGGRVQLSPGSAADDKEGGTGSSESKGSSTPPALLITLVPRSGSGGRGAGAGGGAGGTGAGGGASDVELQAGSQEGLAGSGGHGCSLPALWQRKPHR